MTIVSEDEARDFCARFGDAAAIGRLEVLAKLLLAENSRQNLIAKASEPHLWTRHFADSAQLLVHVPRETSPWLDLGTGAGFPGLVIAALRPDIECVLVESRRKRAEFLSHAASAMGLAQCKVIGSRLETVEAFPAGAISARAFAPLDKLLSLSARFSTRDTHLVVAEGAFGRARTGEPC